MKIVIAGGGKVGYYLVKTLQPFHHNVIMIELKKDRCQDLSDELNIPVYNGDATRINILRDADATNADFFIAVTGLDEENLISCQLAKNNLHAKKTIARVNNPKNAKVFQKLGVDMTVNSTTLIADLIEEAVDYTGMKTLTSLKNNRIIVSELEIAKNSPVINKRVGEIKIPEDCIWITIIKDNELIRPDENQMLMPGDSVILISDLENKKRLKKIFLGNS
jgi:trk system potassium uptake protein TrkA